MPTENGDSPQELQVDDHIAATIKKVREEFPWVRESAIASHMTFVRAHAVYAAALAKLYESLDLSVPRFNMLWLLYRTDGRRLAISELAAHLNVSIPSVMRMVGALEAERWVRTERDVTDKRVRLVTLTNDGHKRLSSLLSMAFEIWGRLWEDLTLEEQAIIVKLLGSVRRSLLDNYIGKENLAALRREEPRREDQLLDEAASRSAAAVTPENACGPR